MLNWYFTCDIMLLERSRLFNFSSDENNPLDIRVNRLSRSSSCSRVFWEANIPFGKCRNWFSSRRRHFTLIKSWNNSAGSEDKLFFANESSSRFLRLWNIVGGRVVRRLSEMSRRRRKLFVRKRPSGRACNLFDDMSLKKKMIFKNVYFHIK